MTRTLAGLLTLLVGVAAASYMAAFRHLSSPPHLTLDSPRILANGSDAAELFIDSRATGRPRISLLEGPSGVTVEDLTGGAVHWTAALHAGVMPGRVRFRVAIAGAPPA